jgi:hypothetical protein
VNQERYRDFDFISGYFIVGGWQLISILIHFFFPRETKIKLRKFHGMLSLGLLILLAILWAIDDESIIMLLIGVLFATPALAILYLIACFLETKALLNAEKPQE